MNKWIYFALSLVFMANAQANQTWCGYKDFFHLKNDNHPSTQIMSFYAEQDLFMQQIGPTSFLVRDTPQCRSGYAHVTVAYDATHWCVLDIKDGPYMSHPTVTAACNGILYLGTTYDGIGSYSYSINLD